MITSQSTSNNVIQKDGFDEQKKLKIRSALEEIVRTQQSTNQSPVSEGKPNYIKFVSDKESKVLSFTGDFEKEDVPQREYDTGQEIPDRYTTRYYFECYDITTPNSDISGAPWIWERGPRDARTILHYLDKGFKTLEVVRNGVPGSKTTTYLINPPLD
jgi:hypothetical protein